MADTQDTIAIREIVNEHVYLVKHIVRKMKLRFPSEIEEDELVSYGMMGLVDAGEKFDLDKGVKFKTYAELRIRGAIIDGMRSNDWVPRNIRDENKRHSEVFAELSNRLGRDPSDSEVAGALGMSEDEYFDYLQKNHLNFLVSLDDVVTSDENGKTFHELIADQNMKEPIEFLTNSEMVGLLADATKRLGKNEQIMLSLYYNEDLNMKEIAEIMGVTESRVSQIRSEALRKLRNMIRKML